jgi:hypothetical protein
MRTASNPYAYLAETINPQTNKKNKKNKKKQKKQKNYLFIQLQEPDKEFG